MAAMAMSAVSGVVVAPRPASSVRAGGGAKNSTFMMGGSSASASGFRGVGAGGSARRRGALVIQMAASKEKKGRDLNMLKGRLADESTLLVAGFRYQGLSVKKMIEFRRALPEGGAAQVDPGFSQSTPRLLSTLET